MKFFKNFKRIYKYSYGCRKYIVLYFILSFIYSITGIIVPALSALVLTNLTSSNLNLVLFYAFFILFIELFQILINFLSNFTLNKFSKIVISKIQINMGKEILKIKLSSIDKHSNGVFIERLTNDAHVASSIFTQGVDRFNDIIKNFGITIIIFILNYQIGILICIFMIIRFYLMVLNNKKIDVIDREYHDIKENTSGFATELIRGIRDIKMLNCEKNFINKFENNINQLNEKNYQLSTTYDIFHVVEKTLDTLFNFILIVFIVYFIYINNITIAVGIIIYQYRHFSLSLLFSIRSILDYVRTFNLACDRIFAIFNNKEFEKEKFGKKHLDKVNGDFVFKDVCFGYTDDKLIINHASFKVNANEMIAFVGKSGVGKTTIFNLLCKLYEIDSGSIMIDGININDLDKESIRNNITVISQNPYIFHMSIRDNLKIVKNDLTDEEMIKACKLACLDEFISTLKDGYDTIIGEGGVNLSGGQKQRLAIARAFIQKTEIILFDEATSALDNETQNNIQKAIANLHKDYTILIIAHRLSTIINCDRILFMENGKIVDEGTHSELLKHNKDYKSLYQYEINKT